nr:hypothetical protein [Cellulosimicrobium cellulans]
MTSTASSSTSPAAQSWWKTSAPPMKITSRSPAAARACRTADSTPSVTNVTHSRSLRFGATGGGVCVTTKIGTWNS